MLRGTAVSPGIALGPAYVLACADRSASARRAIPAEQVDDELARFDAALDRAEKELLALREAVGERLGDGDADIFSAQLMVLEDPGFKGQVVAAVRDKLVNVEAALAQVMEKFARAFDDVADAYLRERAADVRDVGRRVLAALIEEQDRDGVDIPDGSIVVADELLPSVTARLELGRVRGLVTERGGRFSHTSILARSAGMPAVSGVAGAAQTIKTGDALIVDAVSGVVFVAPEPPVRREYDRLAGELRAAREELRHIVDLPSVTSDGTTVRLLANASKFPDTEAAMLVKADGIGLYRTEFSHAVRKTFPTEDEQYEFLARAAERMHPRKVAFRLLDIGGDKTLPYFPLPPARNPSLGQRGIRLLLAHPDLLKRQLRAFLRVSADHPVSILLPVVGGVEEVRRTRAAIREAQQELAAEGKRFDADIPVGAMIEVPAAALIAGSLAREVDFFSLGTNDLVQYLLAADREDEGVAAYYQPLHPAVLRLIQTLVITAGETGRPLTICGDIAGNPFYTELLLGLGLRELSMAPGDLLAVKSRVRAARIEDARVLARHALEAGSAADVETLLRTHGATAPPPPPAA